MPIRWTSVIRLTTYTSLVVYHAKRISSAIVPVYLQGVNDDGVIQVCESQNLRIVVKGIGVVKGDV
jgi:hypothetical protein